MRAMDLQLLNEKHNLRKGDRVVVTDRFSNLSYQGKIYEIINNMPVNKYINELKNVFIDYFYVSFPNEVYCQLLCRGSEVIYNYKQATLGNIVLDSNGRIEKIYRQQPLCGSEYEINFHQINAMLIWRVGYDIKLDR
jgi:hypothetical protein